MAGPGLVVNLSEAAAILGRSQPTIKAWATRGMPVIEAGQKLRDWKIDITAVIGWLEQRAIANAVGDSRTTDIEEARRRKLSAEAAMAEIELAKQRGDCISIDVATDAWLAVLAIFRSRMLAIPTQLAPELVAETDIMAARQKLQATINEALDELAAGSRLQGLGQRLSEGGRKFDDGAGHDSLTADVDC